MKTTDKRETSMIIINSARSFYALIFCIFITIQPIITMPPTELSNEPTSSPALAYLACLCIGAALYAVFSTYFFSKTNTKAENTSVTKIEAPQPISVENNEQFVAEINKLKSQCAALEIDIATEKKSKEKITAAYNTLIMTTLAIAHQAHMQQREYPISPTALYWQKRCKELAVKLEKTKYDFQNYKQENLSPEYKLLLAGRQNTK